MEKIDLVLYILTGVIAFHILGAVLRTYNGFCRNADKLYDLIMRLRDEGKFSDALAVVRGI